LSVIEVAHRTFSAWGWPRTVLEAPCYGITVISRREILAGAAGVLVTRHARADVDPAWRPRSLDVREVLVDGSQSRRFVLGVPNHLAPGERVPLLVLLHGLGETGDERTGAWAWFERYGLGTSYDRLLASRSLRGLALVCPYMPDLPIADPRAFDAYTRWLVETVVPRARQEAPAVVASSTYLAGCSLGGHFSLEFLLRRPDAFGAWGGVQTAIGEAGGRRYGQKLAQAGTREILVETSTGDPFRAGNEALSRTLGDAGVRHTFIELPGPHDQQWLRSSGTERMLAWFDGLARP
jgi:enterochelin esterase-like enzyme